MTIIFIGAIIVIIGGIIGAIGTLKQNKSSSEKSSRIESGVNSTNLSVNELKIQNEDLQKKIEKQSNVIDNLRKENTELYVKLSNSAIDIYNNLTGNESYCAFEINGMGKNGDVGFFAFYVNGKNPVSRITASIYNNDTKIKPDHLISDLINRSVDLGTIDPGKSLTFPNPVKLNKEKGMAYNIQISANNGTYFECFRMKFVKGKWVYAIQIISLPDSKQIFLKIDSDYPEKDKTKIFK